MTAADTAADYLKKNAAAAMYATIVASQEYANAAESNAKSYDEKITSYDLTDQISYLRSDLYEFGISLHRIDNLIILFFNIVINYTGSGTSYFEVGTLPESIRPALNTSQNTLDDSGNFCYFYCDSNGKFGFRYSNTKTGSVGVRTTMIYSIV